MELYWQKRREKTKRKEEEEESITIRRLVLCDCASLVRLKSLYILTISSLSCFAGFFSWVSFGLSAEAVAE